MNLEEIEQSTLNFLSQASNPLVRITTAYEQVVRRSDVVSISLEDYIEFLTDFGNLRFGIPEFEGRGARSDF